MNEEIKEEEYKKELDLTPKENGKVELNIISLTEKDKRNLFAKLGSLPKEEKKEFRDSIEFIKPEGVKLDEAEKEFISKWKGFCLDESLIDKEKVNIILPKEDRLVSVWASEIGKEFSKKISLFTRPELKDVFEIIHSEEGETFNPISPIKFITDIEKEINPVIELSNRQTGDTFYKKKSIGSQLSNTTLQSDEFKKQLPIIKKIYNYPLPMEYKGKITFPKEGYDSRFKCWTSSTAPKISNPNMNLEEAKNIINFLFKEFPFKSEQYRTHSIANLITPFLRGLFPKSNNRTPIFIIEANRERTGKDYLQGIIQTLYDGYSYEDSPISTGSQNSNSEEELRKKVTSGLLIGRRAFHFGNNKENIKSAILESLITTPFIEDRLLGKSELAKFRNELDFSMSGNEGMTFTADLLNRSRPIRLFLDIENANERKFETPNLHLWVFEKRELIFSALFSLIQNWINKGKPKGTVPFASFPEWASICGGILESAGYGSPCKPDEENIIGGDVETQEMKSLFEICFEKKPNQFIKRNEIIDITRKEDSDMFIYWDFTKNTDLTKFGMKLNKFTGRIFSNIKLLIKDPKIKGARKEFKFIDVTPVNLVTPIDLRGFKKIKKVYSIAEGDKGNISEEKDVTPCPNNNNLEEKPCESCSKFTKNLIKGLHICEECSKNVSEDFK